MATSLTSKINSAIFPIGKIFHSLSKGRLGSLEYKEMVPLL